MMNTYSSAVQILPDFPKGPLDSFRNKASFDWRKMKILLQGEKQILLQMKFWKKLEADPLFQRNPTEELSLDDYRKICFQRLKRLAQYELYSVKDLDKSIDVALNFLCFIGMYDASLGTKRALSHEYFMGTIRGSGEKKHMKLIEDLEKFKIKSCFALTEFSHGSDAKKVQTTATYNLETKDFVIHTPSMEASKVWIGNLSKTATHAVLYAQLCTADRKCHGLHAFIIQIRDMATMLPLPGITIGDLGLKLGLNGLDNGFLIFNNFHTPRDSLLGRFGSVTSEGKYISPYKDPNKRFAAFMRTLSVGRMCIIKMAASNMLKCMPIAIRYSAIRKQFGPTEETEWPIIEYPLQQWRIFPYLAAAYVLNYFADTYVRDFMEAQRHVLLNSESPADSLRSAELHALCCAAKAINGWTARDAIQECREACGGHGYLKAAGFGTLRDDNDANCTYEGESNILLMQTSNYLLRLFNRYTRHNDKSVFQQETTNFLSRLDDILLQTFKINELEDINRKMILDAYQWLICYLLMQSGKKFADELAISSNIFIARCNSEVYFCRSLAVAYFEHAAIQKFSNFIEGIDDVNISAVLNKLCLLYALWCLQKHLPTLYEGGYCRGASPSLLIKEKIVQLCGELKDEAVALADVIAPPDFILNSVLGQSNGKIYENMYNAIVSTPGTFDRAPWWKEVVNNQFQTSKL